MMTFRKLAQKPEVVPATTAWYVAELAEARGKQALFTQQAPQRLKALREHALIESAVSSNRIEGVNVDQRRVGTIVFGRPLLRGRNEEEVRGYRDALEWIHEQGAALPVTEDTIRALHRMARGDIWDAGQYKEKDSHIIERFPNSGERVRFRTVAAIETGQYMAALVEAWHRCLEEQWTHPLIALAAFNLDFLCIHPFRDGNGRASRLLLLLQCYHLGFEVGRFISLERLIEQNKERYYETLELSSRAWHEAKHDPWPSANFLLFTLKTAYREFEQRMGQVKVPRGAKTARIHSAIAEFSGSFTLSDLEQACPGVSRDLIRRVLRKLQQSGEVECLGRGPGARWERRGNSPERG